MSWIIRFIINAIVLYLIAKFVPGFNHNVGVWTAVIAAIVFGIVNALIGPILRLLTAPINWITHGVFAFVVNYILFALTVWIAPNFQTTGEINKWLALLYGTIIMMIVATIMHYVSEPRTATTA
jgi:putative membrane protein